MTRVSPILGFAQAQPIDLARFFGGHDATLGAEETHVDVYRELGGNLSEPIAEPPISRYYTFVESFLRDRRKTELGGLLGGLAVAVLDATSLHAMAEDDRKSYSAALTDRADLVFHRGRVLRVAGSAESDMVCKQYSYVTQEWVEAYGTELTDLHRRLTSSGLFAAASLIDAKVSPDKVAQRRSRAVTRDWWVGSLPDNNRLVVVKQALKSVETAA